MKYKVRAIYKVVKVMTVDVSDAAPDNDPNDPACWLDILDEQDVDCNLYEVESAKPATEDDL